jgi:hypothetical protein
MLSFLRFLIRMAEFTLQAASDWHGTVGTDSQSLLDRLFGKKAKTAEECYGSAIQDVNVLTPDWDLLIEIKYALQRLPGVSLKFVKGHQDRRRRYEAISLLAQLNIDADDLATHYQNAHGRALPFALMTPHTAAYLVYPEGTVTAKYASELRHRATSPALTRYIKDKNGWSDGVMEVVNWSASTRESHQSSSRVQNPYNKSCS